MIAQLKRILAKAQEKAIDLNAVARASDVLSFEQKHGISLPQSYREFLLNVGNGGDGPPCCGLNALDDHEQTADGAALQQVFPFTSPWIWENGELSDEGTREQVGRGSICIGEDGCGAYWHLIVTGPERGNPWLIALEGIQPTAPKRGFLQWYEDWLDGNDSFYGLAGSEPTNPIR